MKPGAHERQPDTGWHVETEADRQAVIEQLERLLARARHSGEASGFRAFCATSSNRHSENRRRRAEGAHHRGAGLRTRARLRYRRRAGGSRFGGRSAEAHCAVLSRSRTRERAADRSSDGFVSPGLSSGRERACRADGHGCSGLLRSSSIPVQRVSSGKAQCWLSHRGSG